MAKKNILAPPLTREERYAAHLKRQKQKKQMMIAGGVLILALPIILWFALQKPKAPIYMGVCRTFAELQLAYPQTLEVMTYEQIERVTRLYYTYIDPYGEQHSDVIECKFYFDPDTHRLGLESVHINRNAIDADKVDAFNKSIPVILASKPDFAMPRQVPDNDLVDLRQD